MHPFQADTEERVGVLVLDRRGRLLTVEGPSGKLSLPKGCRHLGETEWDGAMREAWEETGIDLESMSDATFVATVKLLHGTYFLFHIGRDGFTLSLRPQEGESKIIYWKRPTDTFYRSKPCNADLGTFLRSTRQAPKQGARMTCSRWTA
jgi:8-oxo-dGTP pyrophosphatase MutT (NUDIX family)